MPNADTKDLFEPILTMNVGYGFNPIEATLDGFLPPLERTVPPECGPARAFVQNYVRSLIERNEGQSEMRPFISTLVRHLGTEKAASTAMLVMFAMHKVTDTTLPWTWHLLSLYPETEGRLHAELAEVLHGRHPAYEDIAAMPYTNMILREVRRLYPSVWIIGRFVREQHAFALHLVPAGSIVLTSQWVMHRDSRYFPEPDRFDPSRWTEEARQNRPEFSYFPFSGGPRACAGEAFAKAEDAIILGTLAQCWRAQSIPGQQAEPVPQKSDTLRRGVRMILQPRR